MAHIVLVSPEIPENVGAIIRTCVCFGLKLHIVGPMPFVWDLKRIRRSVMDYIDHAEYKLYPNFDEFIGQNPSFRLIATSPAGDALYSKIEYQTNDAILFGCESSGLPSEIFARSSIITYIPMKQGRSLNLSVSVGIIASYVTL